MTSSSQGTPPQDEQEPNAVPIEPETSEPDTGLRDQEASDMVAVDQDPLDREPPSLLGQRVGMFRIGERSGGGAHSSVYRAINEETDEVVALKVLSPGADRVARQRFLVHAGVHLQLHS